MNCNVQVYYSVEALGSFQNSFQIIQDKKTVDAIISSS